MITLNLTNQQYELIQKSITAYGDRIAVTKGTEEGMKYWELEKQLKEQRFTPQMDRKQISFDLDTRTGIPQFYNTVSNAFYHLEKQMHDAGFEHTQGSVYTSREAMDDWECFNKMAKICKELPWLYECATSMNITNVGQTYDMNKWLAMLCDKDKADEMKKAIRDRQENLDKDSTDLERCETEHGEAEFDER